MGIFDSNDETLQALYKRAYYDSDKGFVDPRQHPDLDHALYHYAQEHNCSYDQALILAKTGQKMF